MLALRDWEASNPLNLINIGEKRVPRSSSNGLLDPSG